MGLEGGMGYTSERYECGSASNEKGMKNLVRAVWNW